MKNDLAERHKDRACGFAGIFWNAAAVGVYACQSPVILVFVSRCAGLADAGMVSIAFAAANIFWSLARYGVRNYQVTDLTGRFSLRTYIWHRMLTCASAGLACLAWLAFQAGTGLYTVEKAGILLAVTGFRLMDAMEDVFVGAYQRRGRLDAGAKRMLVRLVLSALAVCVCILTGLSVSISFLAGTAVSVVLLFWMYWGPSVSMADVSDTQKQAEETFYAVRQLFLECLPLCIGTTLTIFIGNAPKYLIDWYLDDQTQAVYGFLMLPVFVLTMLVQFLYQPMVKNIGELWIQKKKTVIIKQAAVQCFLVIGVVILLHLLGSEMGLLALSGIYQVRLQIYQEEFAWLLAGGGCFALASYVSVLLTAARRQSFLAAGSALSFLVCIGFGKRFLAAGGLAGAGKLYFMMNLILLLADLTGFYFGIKGMEKSNE